VSSVAPIKEETEFNGSADYDNILHIIRGGIGADRYSDRHSWPDQSTTETATGLLRKPRLRGLQGRADHLPILRLARTEGRDRREETSKRSPPGL